MVDSTGTGISDITGLIGTLGFPIFIAVWMLTKGSKDSADMRQAISDLTTVVKILNEKIEK